MLLVLLLQLKPLEESLPAREKQLRDVEVQLKGKEKDVLVGVRLCGGRSAVCRVLLGYTGCDEQKGIGQAGGEEEEEDGTGAESWGLL